jgi:hypothetical protein
MLICIPCLEVHQVQPNPCSPSTTQATRGFRGAARSTAAAAGSSAPGTWSGTPRPSTPAGRPPASCCDRIRTSASGSYTGRSRTRPADWTASTRTRTGAPGSAASASKRPHGQHHTAGQDHGDEGDPDRFQRWHLATSPTDARLYPAGISCKQANANRTASSAVSFTQSSVASPTTIRPTPRRRSSSSSGVAAPRRSPDRGR